MLSTIVLSLVLVNGAARPQGVTDDDKHGYDELPSLSVDIDGDGQPDTIRPRTYVVHSATRRSARRRERHETHWIAFDLRLASGRVHTGLFRYRYGDERADYWVWALKPAGDVDGDGRVDLVFYAGDDTTDETVLLVQRGFGFRASSTGRILGDYELDAELSVKTLSRLDTDTGRELPARVVGRWNPRTLEFDGQGLFWVCVPETIMRAEPRRSSEEVIVLGKHDAVIAVFENDAVVTCDGWVEVETEYGGGWVSQRALAASSRSARPWLPAPPN